MIVIGNWKMNKTFAETKEFIEEFAKLYKENSAKICGCTKFAIAAPFTSLSAFVGKEISVAAQNVSYHNPGAHTGEISANMLTDLGVKYVILGHSERRQDNFETNQDVNLKAKVALENGITPVICVGETLEQYEAGETKEVVSKQLKESLKDLDLTKIIVAYEPIWAIGTGKVATAQIADDICKHIKDETSKDLIVQYGGSVKPDNISELNDMEHIDGFLVGGASLDANGFIKLIALNK
ncbi:triose-phosphate isomerase [Mycoplasma phocimorsus]|uniref:triose-phosphate isomerase n=1 Tax=Mycoplasma phocimorsus TaxID=3045839 RepID=UPI0024BF1BAF|nr:triose-phosphate isomerase [Mycoplasma phocimorsus]MDJ1646535.1 triose-phosphate isomerase [Mycoplasma phocimorsus]